MKYGKRRDARAAAVLALAAGSAGAQFVESDVTVLYAMTGVSGEFSGFVASAVGDLNGDGASEIVMGAPFFAGTRGRSHVHDGATGALIGTVGHATSAYYDGASVRPAGDLNNDGVPDFVIGGPGAPFATGNAIAGRVSAYSGADLSLLWVTTGEAADDAFGYSVAGLMDDYDGDGVVDVIATATRWDAPTRTNAGRLYILAGDDGTVLATLNGEGGAFGSSVTSIDDFNGDRKRDIALGARNQGTGARGRVNIVLTTPVLAVTTFVEPQASGIEFGWYFMDGDGDVNADGVNDLYVSDFADSTGGANSGRAYVFSGVDMSLISTQPPNAPGEGFGIGRFCGDVDGDGHTDLYLGAYTSNAGANAGGRGYVISGATNAILRTHTCRVSLCTAGYDAAGVGDVNGDGAPDFLITGAGATQAAAAAFDGVGWVIAGIPAPCPADLSGSSDPNDPAYGQPDGAIDSSDFFYYLDQFTGGNLAVADLTGSSDPNDPAYGVPDGMIDAADFFFYLDLFVAACR